MCSCSLTQDAAVMVRQGVREQFFNTCYIPGTIQNVQQALSY